MATPNEIFTAALAKNRKNQPGIIATPAELFATFERVYPLFWTVAARVNPTFFGAQSVVAFAAGGWARPVDAESIYRLEVAGARINIVPFDERDADPFTGAVYEWGQLFITAGNALDPVAGNITVWYSKKPIATVNADTELEALWPDSYDELLVLEIALILALKDERFDEVTVLKGDRDAWLRRFIAHLEHATVGLTRATGSAQRYLSQTYTPLNALLAGGSDVEI